MLEWIEENREVLYWIAGVTLVLGVASLLALPLAIARIPEDYFASRFPPPGRFASAHPLIRKLWRGGRNLLGGLLCLAGIAMLVLPGQGFLTILVGLLLMEFPGKRALELSIVRRKRVLEALNWLRRRFGRNELRVMGCEADTGNGR